MIISNVYSHKVSALHAVHHMQQEMEVIKIDSTWYIISNDRCGDFPTLLAMVTVNPFGRHLSGDLSDGIGIDMRDLSERHHEFGSLATTGAITCQDEVVHGEVATFLWSEFIWIDIGNADADRSSSWTSATDHVMSDLVDGFSISVEDEISHVDSFLLKKWV